MNINSNLPNSKYLQNQALNTIGNKVECENELKEQENTVIQNANKASIKSEEITADALEILAGYNQISLNNSGKGLATGTSLTGNVAKSIINTIEEKVKVNKDGALSFGGKKVTGNTIKCGVTEFEIIQEYGKYTFKGVSNNIWSGTSFIFDEQDGKMVQIGSSVEKTANGKTAKTYYDTNGNQIEVKESLTGNIAQNIINTISKKVQVNNEGQLLYNGKVMSNNTIKVGVTEFSISMDNGKYVFKGITNNIWKDTSFIFENKDGKIKHSGCIIEKTANGKATKAYYDTNGMRIEVNSTLTSSVAQSIMSSISRSIKVNNEGQLLYNGKVMSNNTIKVGVTEFSISEDNGKLIFKGITNNIWKGISFIFENQNGKINHVGFTAEKTTETEKTVTVYNTNGKKINVSATPIKPTIKATPAKKTSTVQTLAAPKTAAAANAVTQETKSVISTKIQDKVFAKSVNTIANKIKDEKLKACFMNAMLYIDEMSGTALNTSGNNNSKIQINKYAAKTFMNYINKNYDKIRFYSISDNDWCGAYYENNGVYITKSKLNLKENRLSALILHELTHGMLEHTSGYNIYDESVTCLFEKSYLAYSNKNYDPGTVGKLTSSLRNTAAYKSTLPANLQVAKFCAL